MWFRVNTNFKQIICVIAFAMWATNLCAATKVVEGLALTEPLMVELDFIESEYLLVRASQSHANYSLALIEQNTNTVIRKVNFPSDNALDEIFLVHINDCEACSVSLQSVALIDTNSPYKISVESIAGSDVVLIDTFQKLTSAGEFRQKADEEQNEERVAFLRNSKSQLEAVIESKDRSLRHHALLLSVDTYQQFDDHESQKEVLSTLISETEDEDSVVRAYALLDYALYEKDELKAQEIHDSVIKIGNKLNDQRITAYAKNEKAAKLVQNALYDQAISLFNEAKLVFSETNRWRELLISLHNLSWATQRAGMLPDSLAHATQQLLLAETHDDKESQILALYNFAMTYRQIGERFVADEFLDKAIKQHAQLPSNSSLAGVTGAWLLEEKTQTLLTYGAFESALNYADRAKQEFAKLGHPDRSQDINFIEGQIAFAMQNYELAESKFKQSIQYDQENNRTLHEGIHLLRLAELYIAQNKFIDASFYQNEALRILSQTQHYPDLGKAFSQTAELLYYLGASKDAQSLLDRTSAFIEKHALEHDKAQLAYRKALVAYGVGNHSAALESLKHARSLVEETLPKIRQRNLRQTYLALQKSIFELNVKTLLAPNPINRLEALALVETYKARTLAESINILKDDNRTTNNNDLYIRRNSILEQIQKNAALWHANKNQNANSNNLLHETRTLSEQLEKLEVQIASSQEVPEKLAQTITPDQIPNVHSNELVAYFFIGKNKSWLWVITDQLEEVYDLPAEQEITDLVNAVLNQINIAPASRQNSTAWDQESAIRALSDILLSPLEKHLENSAINLITIIPDGPLHGLPFAPLKLPSSVSPLIKDYALSYAPSLMINTSLKERLRYNESTQTTNILVLANPTNSSNSKIDLADLPFSQEEALTIKSIAGENVTLLLSETATKDKLRNELAKPYSILHFATHGLLNKHEPSLSGLALSISNTEDNHLWLSPEISNSNISADLVILSACDSSIGKSISGEGLFSLSRAFIEGGANQVIGTLWRVQDNSTSALFNNFYSNLFDQNLGVAKALQKAQLALYLNNDNDWRDPYFWAGFQLLGGGANQTYAINQ